MRFRKPFILCNAAAGGSSAAAIGSILAGLRPPGEGGPPIHEIAPGERIEETVRAAAADGCDLVVAAGGDGTVSAAMAGVAGTAVPLAIIPVGTTNLIARELGIPLDPASAARVAASASMMRSIDGMTVAGRHYFLQVGVGISALAVDGTTRELKSRFGALAYPGAAAGRLFNLRPRHLDITVDGEPHRVRSIEATVANNGILARMFFRNGPDIRMDDGRLDVCVLVTRTLFDYPRLVLDMLSGRPGSPHVLFLAAARSVRIESRTPLAVQADGDIIGTTPIEIEIHPRAVSVIAPEAAERIADRDLARSLFLDPYLSSLRKQWST
jgi:diacylglycerol kinase family enzyme